MLYLCGETHHLLCSAPSETTGPCDDSWHRASSIALDRELSPVEFSLPLSAPLHHRSSCTSLPFFKSLCSSAHVLSFSFFRGLTTPIPHHRFSNGCAQKPLHHIDQARQRLGILLNSHSTTSTTATKTTLYLNSGQYESISHSRSVWCYDFTRSQVTKCSIGIFLSRRDKRGCRPPVQAS